MDHPQDRNQDRNEAQRREPIYRLIIALMAADIVVGLGLAAVGAFALDQEPMILAGLGLAAIGVVMLLFFRSLAARAGQRGGQR